MTNSRQKGKRGELEFAAELRKHGFEARRGCQYTGSGDTPDVVHSVPGVHFEVKRTEKFRMWEAIDQARDDCPMDREPVVAYRKNNREWMLIMSLDSWTKLKGD